MNLIRFLCNDRKNIYFPSNLEGTEMYLAYDEKCFTVTTEDVKEVTYLRCNHEERGTRFFLHAKDVSQSKDAVVDLQRQFFSISIAKADIWKAVLKTEHDLLMILEYTFSLVVIRSVHLQGKEKWLPWSFDVNIERLGKVRGKIQVSWKNFSISVFTFLVRIIKKGNAEIERGELIFYTLNVNIENMFLCLK